MGQIPTGDTALKRRHEGTEMTTNDKPLTRNYDSDKEKSEIDSDIRVLKIRQRLAIPTEEIAFYNKVKLSRREY